jgi:uncharacterized membrane protein
MPPTYFFLRGTRGPICSSCWGYLVGRGPLLVEIGFIDIQCFIHESGVDDELKKFTRFFLYPNGVVASVGDRLVTCVL